MKILIQILVKVWKIEKVQEMQGTTTISARQLSRAQPDSWRSGAAPSSAPAAWPEGVRTLSTLAALRADTRQVLKYFIFGFVF